jgi:hypothetical protein
MCGGREGRVLMIGEREGEGGGGEGGTLEEEFVELYVKGQLNGIPEVVVQAFAVEERRS